MRECKLCEKPHGGTCVTVAEDEICLECFFDETIPSPDARGEERKEAIRKRVEKIAEELGR